MEKTTHYNMILNPMYLLSVFYGIFYIAFLFAPTISFVANGVSGVASGWDIISVCFSGSSLGGYSIVGGAGAVLIILGLLLFLGTIFSFVSLILGILGLAKKFNTEKYINALILTNLIIFVAATTLIIVLSNLIINQNVGLSSYAFTSLFVGYGQIAFNILPILYVVVHSTIVREIAFSKTMSEKQTTQNNAK